MSIKYIYPQKLLHEDTVLMIAQKLYGERTKRKLSLFDASVLSGVPLLEIDGLECMFVTINFRSVAKLLDLYDGRLEIFPEVFPDLPTSYHRKYFLPPEFKWAD